MNKGYILDEIEDIIIYQDDETKQNHYIVFYKEGESQEIVGTDGLNFFTQYLNKVKGYKRKDLFNGVVANDQTFHFCKSKDDATSEFARLATLQVQKRLERKSNELEKQKSPSFLSFFKREAPKRQNNPIGAALMGDSPVRGRSKKAKDSVKEDVSNGVKENIFKKLGTKISNLRVNHPKAFKGIVATGAVLVASTVLFVGCGKKNKKENNTPKEVTTTVAPTKEPQKEVTTSKQTNDTKKSLWEQALEKATTTQKNFMKKFITGSTYFNKTFAKNHEEKEVLFQDGHKEPVVRFGLSQEAYAAASVLGANLNAKEYQAFLNASDISIEEYKDYYNAWFTQMFYAYAVRGGKEETGILSMVSCEEGQKVVKEIDDLHKALRTARENGNREEQQKALNALYKRKNELFKMEEAVSMEATYENFKKLDVQDYVLLLKPIFDEVAHEYRNWTVEGNKRFYDERDQKVFQEGGIYCHLYEWTMKENVEAQAKKLSSLSYKADESYLDYDAMMQVIKEKLQEEKAYISFEEQGKNLYKVENLKAVSETFNWTNYHEKTCDSKQKTGNKKQNSTGKTSTKKSTREETTTRTEVTEEKVQKSDLSYEERQEATRQEQQIQQSYQEENKKNKEEAEKQAEEKRKEDQAKEDAKKEQLEQEVQKENDAKKDEIEHMDPGPGVSNPTTDGSGAYEDFPDLNGQGNTNGNEEWSDQKDTIIEGEEEYYYDTAATSYEKLAEQIVADLANEGINVAVEQPVQYTKGR